MAGVNDELRPIVRMTYPRDHAKLSGSAVEPGRVVFRSWLLLATIVPFDRHALVLHSVDDGRGFVEESSSWVHRRWRHERRLGDDADGGCTLTDMLTIEPRLSWARPVVASLVGFVFRHRHRRLGRLFAAP